MPRTGAGHCANCAHVKLRFRLRRSDPRDSGRSEQVLCTVNSGGAPRTERHHSAQVLRTGAAKHFALRALDSLRFRAAGSALRPQESHDRHPSLLEASEAPRTWSLLCEGAVALLRHCAAHRARKTEVWAALCTCSEPTTSVASQLQGRRSLQQDICCTSSLGFLQY